MMKLNRINYQSFILSVSFILFIALNGEAFSANRPIIKTRQAKAINHNKLTMRTPNKTPATPKRPNASDNTFDREIHVTWHPVSGTNMYKVFRCNQNSLSSCSKGVAVKRSPYGDKTARPGVLYYYRIKACSNISCSKFSKADRGERKLLRPHAPAKPTASTHLDKEILLGWKPVNNATRYEISKFGAFDHFSNKRYTGPIAATMYYSDKAIYPGASYEYRVYACNASGCSNSSDIVIGKSLPPSSHYKKTTPAFIPQASDATFPNRVHISWDYPMSFSTYFSIFRCTNTNKNSCNCLHGCNSTYNNLTQNSYDDYSAIPGTTYFYRIKVMDSNLSAADPGRRKKLSIQTPQKPNASDSTEINKVVISWTQSGNANSAYHLQRCSNKANINSCKEIDYSKNNSYDDIHTIPGKTVYYRIKHCITFNEGSFHQMGAQCSDLSDSDEGTRKLKLSSIQFTIPVNITHINPQIKDIVPMCRLFNNNVLSNTNEVGLDRTPINVNGRNQITTQALVTVSTNLHPGKKLEDSIRYNCTLYMSKKSVNGLFVYSTTTNDPALKAATTPTNVVTGNVNIHDARLVGNVIVGKMILKIKTQPLKATGIN